MRFPTSFFFTIFTVASFFSDASAAPVQPSQLKARDVISPPITYPKEGDIFTAGDSIVVRWDVSSIPLNSTNQGRIVLAQPTNQSENLDFDHPLAVNFKLTVGKQEITFPPNLTTGNDYALVLFGDSGNLSPPFTIIGQSNLDVTAY